MIVGMLTGRECMDLMRTSRGKGLADEDTDDIHLSISDVVIRRRPMTNCAVRILVIKKVGSTIRLF